jgi:hypothetical protein
MRTVAGRFLCTSGLSVLFVIAGCARYQYVLAQPSQFTRSITEERTRINYPPMEYEFAEEDDSLMMAVINPGQEPVRIVSSKSFIVSPDGESHPLPASSIAPRSYRALLLPPEPPAYRASPSFSIGFGFGNYWGGPHVGTGIGYHDYWYGGPHEYRQVNAPDYWPWKEGPVRMRLSFEDARTNTFEHDFVIERRKVE